MAKQNIAAHIPRDQMLGEVVITGGGAHLREIEQTAAEFFGLPVRIGLPLAVAGLTEAVKQPEYATAVGLVLFGPRGDASPYRRTSPVGGVFSRIMSWFGSIWS
jgi:cell division protein FtsA